MNKGEKKFWKKANKERRPYTDKECGYMYDEDDIGSARYNSRIGMKKELKYMMLMDRIIFPINICPRCKSTNTFHRRMQDRGIANNVWKTDRKPEGDMTIFSKYDLCLSCQKEFFIEIYVWRLL